MAPEPSGRDRRRSRPQAAGQSLTEYRRYALHALFLVIALPAAFLAIHVGVREGPQPALRAPVQQPVQTRAGYLSPPVVLATIPGILVRLQAEAEATAVPSPTPAPTPEPAATATPAPPPQPAYILYIVQPGDTIEAIAGRFGISADYILWNNPEVSHEPDLLLVGANLLIPSVSGIVYTVTLGDTLSDIADYYQIDVQSILAFMPNNIASPDKVSEGMVLVLPGAVPPPPPIAAAVAAVRSAAPPEPDPQPAPPAASAGYIWPWYGNITSTFYEWRGSSIHGAIDIDAFGSYGAPVVAAASGQVVLVSYLDWGLGLHVIIEHADGSRTVYAHLSESYVAIGQYVGQGEPIGAIGCSGYCTGPHLHFEIWIGGSHVDPLAYLP